MAAIRLGNNDTSYKVGSGDCTIYLGTTLLYSGGTPPTPPTPTGYSTQYLTFKVLDEDTTFNFTCDGLSYSVDDGTTWTNLAANTNTPTVSAGNKILFKGQLQSNVCAEYGVGEFKSNGGTFDIEGNLMSILYGDNFIGQTTFPSGTELDDLFAVINVVSAENLILPATALTEFCYYEMFQNCSHLTTAPVLPATTLASDCYGSMFRNCTSLTSITCLATDISAGNCTDGWVNGVASSGTFTKASSMSSWGTGNSGIPSNWTVQDYNA